MTDWWLTDCRLTDCRLTDWWLWLTDWLHLTDYWLTVWLTDCKTYRYRHFYIYDIRFYWFIFYYYVACGRLRACENKAKGNWQTIDFLSENCSEWEWVMRRNTPRMNFVTQRRGQQRFDRNKLRTSWRERKRRKQSRRDWNFREGAKEWNLWLFCFLFFFVPYNKQFNNLNPRPTVLTSLSLGQYGEASVWDFPIATSLSVIK